MSPQQLAKESRNAHLNNPVIKAIMEQHIQTIEEAKAIVAAAKCAWMLISSIRYELIYKRSVNAHSTFYIEMSDGVVQ